MSDKYWAVIVLNPTSAIVPTLSKIYKRIVGMFKPVLGRSCPKSISSPWVFLFSFSLLFTYILTVFFQFRLVVIVLYLITCNWWLNFNTVYEISSLVTVMRWTHICWSLVDLCIILILIQIGFFSCEKIKIYRRQYINVNYLFKRLIVWINVLDCYK